MSPAPELDASGAATAEATSVVACSSSDEVTDAAGAETAVPDLRLLEFVVLRAAPDQVSVARRVTDRVTAGHPACDVAAWLVSEMVTNAVEHSNSVFVTLVIATRSNGDLRIGVSDQGHAGLPRLISRGLLEEHGRGIRVVNHFSKKWGFTRTNGTTVWFELDEHAPQRWLDALMSKDDLHPMEDLPCRDCPAVLAVSTAQPTASPTTSTAG